MATSATDWAASDLKIGAKHVLRGLEFGHLEAGFHFVPEGRAIVARRFIAGLAIHRICVLEGRLKLDLGCYESAVPDRFKVEIGTRRATSPAQEEPSQRNNDVPKIRP